MKSAVDTAKYGPDKIAIPLGEVRETFNNTDAYIERVARGYLLGSTNFKNKREIRSALETKVTERIGRKGKFLVDKLFELANGVYIAEKVGKKEVRYYQVPPKLEAIVYLLDRVLGKPTQHIEKSEEKKGLMVVEHIIRNLAGDAPAQEVIEGEAITIDSK